MRTKYNFGLPVGAGGCAVKLFKRVSKIAFSASKYSTSLSKFANTASNAIDSPNFAFAVLIMFCSLQAIIFKTLFFLSVIKSLIPSNS